ncbi:hypothetical protein QCD60_13040 [Pokkaliibacter sp. MBI-7]|uniref:hypothetical protein n=1 Tax=Pokkaliibacter sp. MBI-7 TaxID=3040600 RepID=UPI002448321A|nr:hypothetical protein [Pokkaliibacter sp. MBI-7]MDH2433500.1 hypothetical protein [Pokkaliibacter sp. MBI-7]
MTCKEETTPFSFNLPSLPSASDDHFAGFLWNRVLDGGVRDNIFDYGKGLANGAISVANGVGNFFSQAYRQLSGDPQAELEGQAFDYGLQEVVTNPTVRTEINKYLFQEGTDLKNYTSENIGRVIGRTATGIILRPLGAIATIGDIGKAMENGSDYIKAAVFGED